MARKTAWRAVAEALKAEGIERVFGLPGNPLHLVADLERTTTIENVLVRHEHSGAACAYAHARVTGQPAVCYGSPGPGITNMATALLEATSGSVPVVAIANGVPQATDGKGAFQELDSVALMRPVTKWAVRVATPEQVPWTLQRAFSIAKNGRPGAVFIDIPSDLGLAVADMPAYRPSPPRLRSRPDAADVAKAVRLITRAQKPLVLCGSGAVSAGAGPALLRLCMARAMPFMTTPGGRGVIPETHTLAFGQVGLYFTAFGKDYFEDVDLVISLGSRLEDFSTGGWQLWPKKAKLIQIDIDPEAIFLNLEPDVALVGDAALAVEDLLEALPELEDGKRRYRLADFGRAKKPFLKRIADDAVRRRKPVQARQVVAAVNHVFGRDTIMVHENGGADLWSYYWPYYRVMDEGDSVPMGEQTAMGLGVIGAIGAKLARPDKKVVCVTGDGAMQMGMMELATAAERQLGITWIVLNNHCLGWPQYIQMLEGQALAATNFGAPTDFAKLAVAQGCRGFPVLDGGQVDSVLRTAFNANRRGQPAVVDVQIERHDYPKHFVDFHREVWGLGAKGRRGRKKRGTAAG